MLDRARWTTRPANHCVLHWPWSGCAAAELLWHTRFTDAPRWSTSAVSFVELSADGCGRQVPDSDYLAIEEAIARAEKLAARAGPQRSAPTGSPGLAERGGGARALPGRACSRGAQALSAGLTPCKRRLAAAASAPPACLATQRERAGPAGRPEAAPTAMLQQAPRPPARGGGSACAAAAGHGPTAAQAGASACAADPDPVADAGADGRGALSGQDAGRSPENTHNNQDANPGAHGGGPGGGAGAATARAGLSASAPRADSSVAAAGGGAGACPGGRRLPQSLRAAQQAPAARPGEAERDSSAGAAGGPALCFSQARQRPLPHPTPCRPATLRGAWQGAVCSWGGRTGLFGRPR
jgi:hypothetical protein